MGAKLDKKKIIAIPVFDCGHNHNKPGFIIFYQELGVKGADTKVY
jgi:hypothetical protein